MRLQERLHRTLAWFKRDRPGGTTKRTLPDTTPAPSQSQLQDKLGYQFSNLELLQQALLHRSHLQVAGAAQRESNERLEFLGDAVLGVVVNEYLYRRFPRRTEGDLTKMKSLLVCGARLSEVAAQLDLGSHVRMSRSEAATGGRKRSSILADTMEAIIGAVYLDGGLEPARRLITSVVLETSANLLSRRGFSNYKSRLQELIQARYKTPPRYRLLKSSGPDHARVFTIGVTFNGVLLGSGEGRNKKAAEQRAAKEALDRLAADPDLLDSRDS